MKSDDRHKLKTNELADSLGDIPVFFREYGSRIAIVAVLAIAVVFGLWQWVANARASRQEQIDSLQSIMVNREKSQKQAVEQARLQADDSESEQVIDESTNVDSVELAMQLSQLAAKASDGPVGMMAILQEAQAIWSQIFFSAKPFSDAEKEQLCVQAEKVYQKLQSKYAQQPVAVASAQIGLGLIAENRGQWDHAREIYQKVIANKKLAGTLFPRQAQSRLDIIEYINRPVIFSAEPPEEPAKAPQPKESTESISDETTTPNKSETNP